MHRTWTRERERHSGQGREEKIGRPVRKRFNHTPSIILRSCASFSICPCRSFLSCSMRLLCFESLSPCASLSFRSSSLSLRLRSSTLRISSRCLFSPASSSICEVQKVSYCSVQNLATTRYSVQKLATTRYIGVKLLHVSYRSVQTFWLLLYTKAAVHPGHVQRV